MVHRASFSQRILVETAVRQIDRISDKHYLTLFEQNKSLLEESIELRKQLNKHDSNPEFKELLERISAISIEIEQRKLEVKQIDEQISQLSLQIDQRIKDKSRVEQKLLETQKNNKTFEFSKRIIALSQKFRSLQKKKKLQEVEIEALSLLNKIIRKQDFVKHIEIHSETFDVSLISHTGAKIEIKTLSAGEKEILLLCLIVSMVKTSGRRLPFIFDTLLGRLDQSHKEKILTQLIPNCGEQVIILSTNTEIDSKHFTLVQPLLSHCYTLSYDTNRRTAYLEKDKYFSLILHESAEVKS
jgi:DNA sulfur modification protein DndD